MWKKTSKEICIEIRKHHENELTVFGSFTDIDGYGYHWSSGHPKILTEWGFKDAKKPLYKVEMTKETRHDKNWKYEYFLYFTL